MKTTKLLNLFAVAITACVMTACGAAGIGKLAMDSEEAVTKVKDIVSSNIDTGEWKIVEIEWNEGVGDAATLENNLNNGGIYVKMVKRNNGVFVQNFIGQLGWKPTAIDTDHWYDKLYYDKVTPIDAANLDVAAIMKHINDAKAMIPAEYEFRSLAKYQIKAGVPSGTSGATKSATSKNVFPLMRANAQIAKMDPMIPPCALIPPCHTLKMSKGCDRYHSGW